jgi:hypothetical protein
MAGNRVAPIAEWFAACDRAGLSWHKPLAKEYRYLRAVADAAMRLRLHSKPLEMSEEDFWRNPQLNVPNQGSKTLNRALARLARASGARDGRRR